MGNKELMHKTKLNNLLVFFWISMLFVLGIIVRTNLSAVTPDMKLYIQWYTNLQGGILPALGKNFTNYTPPYTYLLTLATMTSNFLPKVAAIKLISVLADFINTFLVYKIVRMKYQKGLRPIIAAGIFLCLPTIFINSAIWGQTDSIYTIFLLASLYFFLKERSFLGMLAFSISFAFKPQAIFFIPFLVILFFKKQVKLWYFLLVPAVYIIFCLPVIFLGRGWVDVLTIYFNQNEPFFYLLSGNAPNLYIFIPNRYFQQGVVIGLCITLFWICTWIVVTVRGNIPLNRDRLALIALISVALLPFLLPKMRDRYFYPADIFSLVVGFFIPEIWFVPVAYQIVSGLSYTIYLLSAPVVFVYIGAMVNVIVVAFLLWKQYRIWSSAHLGNTRSSP